MDKGEMGNSVTMYETFEYVVKFSSGVNLLRALLDLRFLGQLQICFFQSNIMDL